MSVQWMRKSLRTAGGPFTFPHPLLCTPFHLDTDPGYLDTVLRKQTKRSVLSRSRLHVPALILLNVSRLLAYFCPLREEVRDPSVPAAGTCCCLVNLALRPGTLGRCRTAADCRYGTPHIFHVETKDARSLQQMVKTDATRLLSGA